MRIVRAVAMLLVRAIVHRREAHAGYAPTRPSAARQRRSGRSAATVKAGQQRCERANPESDRAGDRAAGPGVLKDRVLRPEAREAKPPPASMPTPVIASVPITITQKVIGISFRSAP